MKLHPRPATLALCAALVALGTVTAPLATPPALAAPVTLTFDSPSVIPIPDGVGAADSPIVVAGVVGPVLKLRVSVHVTHPLPDDLVLRLTGPDGTTMILSEENGASYDNDEPGENYGTAAQPITARTIFDDDAPMAIYDSGAPFVGSFQPEEGPFTTYFGGKSDAAINGTWTLRVEDLYEEDSGALRACGLEITSNAP